MKLYHLSSGPLGVNSYFLVNEQTKGAVLIDGGENYNLIKKTERDLGIQIKALLLTHAHFDHAGNAYKLQRDGVKVYVSQRDGPKLLNDENLGADFGRKFQKLFADALIKDGEVLDIEGIKIKAIATPGHTDGSMTFVVDNMMFTGDTLFNGSVGRTDFKTGDRKDLVRSVKKLFAYSGDYNVYPGHGEFTTLSYEREHNWFLDYDC